MKDQRWIFGLVIVILAIGIFSYYGFKKTGTGNSNAPTVAGENTGAEVYYDDNAKVMEFYSDYCSWCIKQKEVLAKLGEDGYRVKSMNVGKDATLWETYKISGTPTFIADNGKGERIEGYQDYDALKSFLDKNK